MIKKINFLLVVTSIIVSLYFVFTRDYKLGLMLKDASIIITITGIFFIEKIFKIKINDGLKFAYILFVFVAHFLGANVELYNKIYWFDKFTHFVSGILTTFVAIFILVKNKHNKNLVFNILFLIFFSLAIAALWEIFEYLSSYYLNLDPQRVALTGVSDTMGDIIVAFLGAIMVSICYYFEHTSNHELLIKKFEKLI